MKPKHKYYRLNHMIQSRELRLLDEEGKQIGVVSKIEALQKAQALGVDVVEVAPSAKPPVAKLIDFKKFKYQEAKKERESKKTQKNVGVKEVRLGPFIDDHDLHTRLIRAKEFLADGNQVKINIWFRGREITRKEFGFAVMKRFLAGLDAIKVVREPQMRGRTLEALVVPDKKKDHEENQNQKNSGKAL